MSSKKMLCVATEGAKYIGSKREVIPYILGFALMTGAKTVLDGFSGSTRVSQGFMKIGYSVVCNDISVWSEVFGKCYVCNSGGKVKYMELIEYLNNIKPYAGWFTENYGGDPEIVGGKYPWQRHNTMRLDAIRDEIDRISLTESERAVALTSLILALCKVDNTANSYVSYLRSWSKRSYLSLKLSVPDIISSVGNCVYRRDIMSLTDSINTDLAYYDPPYGPYNDGRFNSSRVYYSSCYHLWKTIILNDRPKLHGITLLRDDVCNDRTVFENVRYNENSGRFFMFDALCELLGKTRARWVILSCRPLYGKRVRVGFIDVIRGAGKLLRSARIMCRRGNVVCADAPDLSEVDLSYETLHLIEKG